MNSSIKTSTRVLDIGLIGAIAVFMIVLRNTDKLAPAFTNIVMVILTIAIVIIGVKREAAREATLDEVQLAAVSFGAR